MTASPAAEAATSAETFAAAGGGGSAAETFAPGGAMGAPATKQRAASIERGEHGEASAAHGEKLPNMVLADSRTALRRRRAPPL